MAGTCATPKHFHVPEAFTSPLADGVARALVTGSRRLAPEQPGSVELEVRMGKIRKNPGNRTSFESGVPQSFFNGMLKHLTHRLKHVYTDTVDVGFENRVRLTVESRSIWTNREGSNVSQEVRITEAIHKETDGVEDFTASNAANKPSFDLRLGVASETPLAKGDEVEHREMLIAAFKEAFEVTDESRLYGGCDLQLRTGAVVEVKSPAPAVVAVTNTWLPAVDADPLVLRDGTLDAALAGQLVWTLLQPVAIPALKGKDDVVLRLRDPQSPGVVHITNRAGTVVLAEGQGTAVRAACAYHCTCPATSLVPHRASRFAGSKRKRLLPQRFRRKKRFSFKIPNAIAGHGGAGGTAIDMTVTTAYEDLFSLLRKQGATENFEVEVERVLPKGTSVDAAAAARGAVELVSTVAAYLYGVKLPAAPPSEVLARLRECAEGGAPNGGGALEAAPDAATADFYSQLERDESSRPKSLIYHMRCLNNWVKSAALQVCVGRALDGCAGGGVRVLDLACGKGADMPKFVKAAAEASRLRSVRARISGYVGVDIARGSLDDAVQRWQDMARRGARAEGEIGSFPVTFACVDLGVDDLCGGGGGSSDEQGGRAAGLGEKWESAERLWVRSGPVLAADARFDVASMQFAFHYMFQSAARAAHLFSTLARHVRVGGCFVATTVNAASRV